MARFLEFRRSAPPSERGASTRSQGSRRRCCLCFGQGKNSLLLSALHGFPNERCDWNATNVCSSLPNRGCVCSTWRKEGTSRRELVGEEYFAVSRKVRDRQYLSEASKDGD